jgi:hypothetical protein
MGRRKNPYSSLTVSATNRLHKEIEARYKDMGESELTSIYSEKKECHENLKLYTQRSKSQAENYKIYDKTRSSLKNEQRRAESDAIRELSPFQAIKTIFSTRQISQKEIDVSKRAEAHKKNLPQLVDYSDETDKRKFLYHELVILRALLKKKKEQRIKALAKSALNKARDGSSSLKKRLLKADNRPIDCPYCKTVITNGVVILDHIRPVALGGLTSEDNTVLICESCNKAKGMKTLYAFCKEKNYEFEEIFERLIKNGKSV